MIPSYLFVPVACITPLRESTTSCQIGMYTPWVNSVKYLKDRCPAARLVVSDFTCADHLPSVDNFTAFMDHARAVVKKNDDRDSFLLRLGEGDSSHITDLEVSAIPHHHSYGILSQLTTLTKTLFWCVVSIEGCLLELHLVRGCGRR